MYIDRQRQSQKRFNLVVSLSIVFFSWSTVLEIRQINNKIKDVKQQIKDAEIKCIVHNYVAN